MKAKLRLLSLVLAFVFSFAYGALTSLPTYATKPGICQGNATYCDSETICWWVNGELHCYTEIYYWLYNV